MKDAYYFSHDSNARHDPKCSALIHDFGMEGYGVFWAIIEILSEQKNYKLKKFPKLIPGLAKQFGMNAEALLKQIEAMLHDYELLVEDDNYIWSESLLRRMELRDKKRQAKIEAGRLGGVKSGISRKRAKQNEALLKQNEALVEANEAKESKGKESKKNKSSMAEHFAPPVKGQDNSLSAITILRNYFADKYREHVGQQYPHNYARDGKLLKGILKACNDDIEFCKRFIDWFFECGDKYLSRNGFSIPLLKTKLTAYHAALKPEETKPKWEGLVFDVDSS